MSIWKSIAHCNCSCWPQRDSIPNVVSRYKCILKFSWSLCEPSAVWVSQIRWGSSKGKKFLVRNSAFVLPQCLVAEPRQRDWNTKCESGTIMTVMLDDICLVCLSPTAEALLALADLWKDFWRPWILSQSLTLKIIFSHCQYGQQELLKRLEKVSVHKQACEYCFKTILYCRYHLMILFKYCGLSFLVYVVGAHQCVCCI